MVSIKLHKPVPLRASREPELPAEGLRLVGVWELRAIETEYRDRGERRPAHVSIPTGHIMFTPLGRVLAMVMRPSRAQSGAERESDALFRATFAYSGWYRLEGERWITRVDRTWSEIPTDAEQRHSFRLDGDRLEVPSAWRLGARPDERLHRTVFSFTKMKMRPN